MSDEKEKWKKMLDEAKNPLWTYIASWLMAMVFIVGGGGVLGNWPWYDALLSWLFVMIFIIMFYYTWVWETMIKITFQKAAISGDFKYCNQFMKSDPNPIDRFGEKYVAMVICPRNKEENRN